MSAGMGTSPAVLTRGCRVRFCSYERVMGEEYR